MSDPVYETALQRVAPSFLRYKEVDVAYLFGSRARGDATLESDWDFAILLSRNFEDPYGLVGLIADLAGALNVDDREVNVVILNDAELSLAHRVVSEGRVIFERDVERRVEFEVNVIKFYLDFKPLLNQVYRSLIEEYTHGQAK